ncbi:AraC family transcriptional regulator [Bradyrhizobium sp. 2TAF24]|uniref:AraC family transcriptional regulator n=1 Tax=Bradyrhizobium sp. 2TAF24 TaxID=3233011 RepID=UPI003F8F7D18
MTPVARALWFIESKVECGMTLAEIALFAGVSRYHLCRAFGEATGLSVMRYVRGRRLSRAARQLADGAPDILTVALDAGYGSHEAFTRAFREQFAVTPETVRAQGNLAALTPMEPIRMDETPRIELAPPRFENHGPLLVAGLGERYRFETNHGIPAQWHRFIPHIGHVPGQIGMTTYGVCCNADGTGNFDYIAGVEVASFDDLPAEFSRVRIPERRYAVFSHHNVSTMRDAVRFIWSRWLPSSGHEVADAPDIERYDERFDPETGTGTIEIWIPLAR